VSAILLAGAIVGVFAGWRWKHTPISARLFEAARPVMAHRPGLTHTDYENPVRVETSLQVSSAADLEAGHRA
jgi:hypothetical protein